MAYLKRFTVVLAVLAVTIALSASATDLSPSAGDFRQASDGLPVTKNLKKQPSTADFSEKLHNLGISLRPGSFHRSDSKPTADTSRKCQSIVYKTLMQLPSSHREQLQELTLFYTEDGRRGLGGQGSVILRCLNVTDSELASVLIHEMGHLVDGGLLTGSNGFSGFYDFEIPVADDDKSANFYKISWISEIELKEKSTVFDFVSRYAMTDPFEDFAETYTYYRLHGPEFLKLAEKNEDLMAKYNFMKNEVFEGKEFGNYTRPVKINNLVRRYDTTVLPF